MPMPDRPTWTSLPRCLIEAGLWSLERSSIKKLSSIFATSRPLRPVEPGSRGVHGFHAAFCIGQARAKCLQRRVQRPGQGQRCYRWRLSKCEAQVLAVRQRRPRPRLLWRYLRALAPANRIAAVSVVLACDVAILKRSVVDRRDRRHVARHCSIEPPGCPPQPTAPFQAHNPDRRSTVPYGHSVPPEARLYPAHGFQR